MMRVMLQNKRPFAKDSSPTSKNWLSPNLVGNIQPNRDTLPTETADTLKNYQIVLKRIG